MLDRVYKFQTLGQALAFYNNCNPARQRYVNLLEPDSGPNNHYFKDFSGDSPSEVWCKIAYAIGHLLRGRTDKKYWVWMWYSLGQRTEEGSDRRRVSRSHLRPVDQQFDVEVIAKQFQIHKRTVFKHIEDVNGELEDILVERGLLQPVEEAVT